MRAFAYVALALLTLFTVSAVIHRLAPYPTDDLIGDKLRFFAEHKDDYDLLIIGSSRTMAGVIPKQIEALAAAQGVELRAFNLAMNAMDSHEADSSLRKALALRPARLRWVLSELDYWEGELRPRKRFHHRTYLWHDAVTTYSSMRAAYLYGRRPEKKWEYAGAHLLHFGGYATALGRGPAAVAALVNKPEPPKRRMVKQVLADDGYQEPAWCRKKDRQTNFSKPCGASNKVDHMAFYHKRVKRLEGRLRKPAGRSNINLRAVESRSANLRRAGIVPIYFIPPRIRPTPDLQQLQERGVVEHLFAFNNPVAYAELYSPENRCDCDHLDQAGATMLTAMLAEHLVELASGPTR